MGLYLYVNFGQDYSAEGVSFQTGAEVYVHSPNHLPVIPKGEHLT